MQNNFINHRNPIIFKRRKRNNEKRKPRECALQKKIVVLGAGISGLATAWKLSEKGGDVEVLERRGTIGGIASSFKRNDYTLDFGPHKVYTQIPGVLEEYRQLLGADLIAIPKKQKILNIPRVSLQQQKLEQELEEINSHIQGYNQKETASRLIPSQGLSALSKDKSLNKNISTLNQQKLERELSTIHNKIQGYSGTTSVQMPQKRMELTQQLTNIERTIAQLKSSEAQDSMFKSKKK